jgi:hypothetical protein
VTLKVVQLAQLIDESVSPLDKGPELARRILAPPVAQELDMLQAQVQEELETQRETLGREATLRAIQSGATESEWLANSTLTHLRDQPVDRMGEKELAEIAGLLRNLDQRMRLDEEVSAPPAKSVADRADTKGGEEEAARAGDRKLESKYGQEVAARKPPTTQKYFPNALRVAGQLEDKMVQLFGRLEQERIATRRAGSSPATFDSIEREAFERAGQLAEPGSLVHRSLVRVSHNGVVNARFNEVSTRVLSGANEAQRASVNTTAALLDHVRNQALERIRGGGDRASELQLLRQTWLELGCPASAETIRFFQEQGADRQMLLGMAREASQAIVNHWPERSTNVVLEQVALFRALITQLPDPQLRNQLREVAIDSTWDKSLTRVRDTSIDAEVAKAVVEWAADRGRLSDLDVAWSSAPALRAHQLYEALMAELQRQPSTTPAMDGLRWKRLQHAGGAYTHAMQVGRLELDRGELEGEKRFGSAIRRLEQPIIDFFAQERSIHQLEGDFKQVQEEFAQRAMDVQALRAETDQIKEHYNRSLVMQQLQAARDLVTQQKNPMGLAAVIGFQAKNLSRLFGRLTSKELEQVALAEEGETGEGATLRQEFVKTLDVMEEQLRTVDQTDLPPSERLSEADKKMASRVLSYMRMGMQGDMDTASYVSNLLRLVRTELDPPFTDFQEWASVFRSPLQLIPLGLVTGLAMKEEMQKEGIPLKALPTDTAIADHSSHIL